MKKKYSRPKKPFDKIRIEEENLIKEKYGLKNKKEIWKADASIKKIRNQAKALITKSDQEKELFIKKLQKKGFPVNALADALGLDNTNLLKRRLQTIVFNKKLAKTVKQARQFVVHKKISIENEIINKPSYQVSLKKEPLIKLNLVLKSKKKKSDNKKINKEELPKEENGTRN